MGISFEGISCEVDEVSWRAIQCCGKVVQGGW